MTKQELMEIMDGYDDNEEIDLEEIDLEEILREQEERRARLIEEIEERQHESGFYAFQDQMENWRNER